MKEEITKSFNQLIKNDNEQIILELNNSIHDSHDTRKMEDYNLEVVENSKMGCLSEGDNKDII